jgi:hypothetical protein
MKRCPSMDSDQPGRCPISWIADISQSILRECAQIFWPHNKISENSLWLVSGLTFPEFLEDYLIRLNNIDIIDPTEMLPIIVEKEWVAKRVFKSEAGNHKPKVSRLALSIYKQYIKAYCPPINTPQLNLPWILRAKFQWLSKPFIQAFDSVLITWANQTNSIQEWQEKKDDMWRVLINLARIPSSIQETLLWNNIEVEDPITDEPYITTEMATAWGMLKADPNLLFNWIMKGKAENWTWPCPAIEDWSLKRSFDLMFEIYWHVWVKPKEVE